MKNFTRAKHFSVEFLSALIERAQYFKAHKNYPDLSGKLFGAVFFNPSLRTKLSFEAAMARSGGQTLTISPGGSTWAFESKFGVRMDSDKPEHLKEAVRVMSRYVDALGVRSFSGLKSLDTDLREEILSAFEEYSTVPLVSLESGMEHPCQMLADMLTVHELFPEPKGRTFCLRWAPHIKPLPLAVPHSAALAAAFLGMNVTLVAPPGYGLAPEFEKHVTEITRAQGGVFSRSEDPESLPKDCSIVYVKSWGAPRHYGSLPDQEQEFQKFAGWTFHEELFEKETHLMHCLPVRRNVVATDGALDHERSVIIQQAENRLWAQLAVLDWIFH